jgi:predicted ribosome quality control (RQC) complex YloA/Tae2 family protein
MQRAEITLGRSTRVTQYLLDGGWEILAGKTSRDNDELSLKLAGAKDWWFHVRGTSGSHVLLRYRDDAEPDRDVLRTAARVAAFHSKARAGGQVSVTMTRAAFVSKPRGSKPGTVTIRKERVLKVRPALPE